MALTVVFMSLGAFVEVLDLTAAALCSVIMMFVFIEVGKPYTFCVWLGASLLGAVLLPHSFVWISYLLVFGIYPIIKSYVERTKRPLWIVLKFVYFNACAILMILASEYILGVPFFTNDLNIPLLEDNTYILQAVIYILLIAAMFVYDVFMTFAARFYFVTLRQRIQKILK